MQRPPPGPARSAERSDAPTRPPPARVSHVAPRGSAIGEAASRDLLNTLAGVIGRLDVLRRARGSARAESIEENVAAAIHGAELAMRLAREVQASTRGGDLHPADISILDALDTALAMSRPHLDQRAVVVLGPRDDAQVIAREHELVRVFTNLLLDSVHGHTPGTPPSDIHVSVVRVGRVVEAIFEDRALLLPKETIARVLDPTSVGPAACALGVQIARRLVTGLGGRLAITSDEVSGTRVVVRLPLSPIPRIESPGGAGSSHAPQEPPERP